MNESIKSDSKISCIRFVFVCVCVFVCVLCPLNDSFKNSNSQFLLLFTKEKRKNWEEDIFSILCLYRNQFCDDDEWSYAIEEIRNKR
mmetsp:Transcript_43344/g.48533  ORF Transcript_43344/g.48533 Transcript_43344/m.48533 type:complete len:87 (+) Transcript_43344:207-467(+)